MGDAGVFCKYCVAVGLTCLDGGISSGCSKRKHKKSEPAITISDIRQSWVKTEYKRKRNFRAMISLQYQAKTAKPQAYAMRAAIQRGEASEKNGKLMWLLNYYTNTSVESGCFAVGGGLHRQKKPSC